MQEISLVLQTLVYDQISSSEVKLHEYPISKEMAKHCQQFHKRYQHYLTGKEEVVKEAEVEHKVKVVDEEMKNMQKIRKGSKESKRIPKRGLSPATTVQSRASQSCGRF